MRNLIHARDIEETPLRPIIRQQRPLREKEALRRIREAGRKQATLTLQVARAMKGADA